MDIMLSIVQLSQSEYDEFVKHIKASNLPKLVGWDLIDLLDTAREQTEQAFDMGWL